MLIVAAPITGTKVEQGHGSDGESARTFVAAHLSTIIGGLFHSGQGFIHLAAEVGTTSSPPLLNESSCFKSIPLSHHYDFTR